MLYKNSKMFVNPFETESGQWYESSPGFFTEPKNMGELMRQEDGSYEAVLGSDATE